MPRLRNLLHALKPAVVVSCEHGGHAVPSRYRATFAKASRALASHRGWDAGALVLAREVARALEAPLFACTTTRLLVDPHRSLGHRRLFSEWTRGLPREERERILTRWWRPHRARVAELVRAYARRGRAVLHLSIHSFTPRWKGRARDVDVGFLYDPARRRERDFATRWLEALRLGRDDLRLKRNHPYRGNADGLTTTLRADFGERLYLGIELEVSQRFPLGDAALWRSLRRDLVGSLTETVSETAL